MRFDLNTGTRQLGTGIKPYTGGMYPIEVVRLGHNTLPITQVWFGTKSIPVPDTSVSSVRLPHRYPTLRQVQYDPNNTGTRRFGKCGTTSKNTSGTGIPHDAEHTLTYFAKWRKLYRQQSEKQLKTRVHKYSSTAAAPNTKTEHQRIRQKKSGESTRTKNRAIGVDGRLLFR